MSGEYISREAAISRLNENLKRTNTGSIAEVCYSSAIDSIRLIPAADVEPVKHAYWVKRMERRVERDHDVYTPIWSCSNCGRDYDPASCSIIKYCYICGARMDGGQD